MPVVINEFEVLEAPPAESRKTDHEPPSPASPPRPIDPGAIRPALGAIATQQLRTWAH